MFYSSFCRSRPGDGGWDVEKLMAETGGSFRKGAGSAADVLELVGKPNSNAAGSGSGGRGGEAVASSGGPAAAAADEQKVGTGIGVDENENGRPLR